MPSPDECGNCALEAQHPPDPCAYICGDCGGSGRCPACDGDGEDGSGLPHTCMECSGSGRCISGCEDGLVTEDYGWGDDDV